MQDNLTKEDVEDGLRRAVDAQRCSPWYNADAAAAYLSSTPGTLRVWCSLGTGARYHIVHGKVVRYHVSDLDAFIRGEDGR